MKITMMLAFAGLLLTTAACKKSKSGDNSGGDQYITREAKTGDGFTMLTEKKLYDQVKKITDDSKGQAFTIESVSRRADSLIVKVTYSVACSVPSFDVIWDGRVMLTYPYQVNLVLKMNADACDSKSAQVTKELKIDLHDYVGDFASDKGTVFFVTNASTKEETDLKPQHN